ncbi:MAG: hypothetical protein IMY72_07085 [Bacteroidetes bacterium]|nr:hypothetical protein [Bacteroidota bacterium]
MSKFKRTENSDKRFLYFMTYTSWYILVVELCKVFQHDNKNQHFNVYGFLNKLKNDYKKLECKDLLSKSEIDKLYNDFNSEEIISIRDKLVILRNKFYAHTDRQDEQIINDKNVDLLEIKKLFDILKNFIFEIKSIVFHSHVIFEEDIFVGLDDVLKNIDKNNKRQHEKFLKEVEEEVEKRNEKN